MRKQEKYQSNSLCGNGYPSEVPYNNLEMKYNQVGHKQQQILEGSELMKYQQ